MKAEPFERTVILDDGTEKTVTVHLVSEPPKRRTKPEPKGCADSSLLSFGAEIAGRDGGESHG